MIDRPSRLVLLGHPVSQSVSPLIQSAALEAAGIPLTYSLLDVRPEALEETLSVLALERAAGNITIPHKEAVAARCARLSPLAARCGAVNVFWHERGRLIGDNSDVGGVEAVLHSLLGPAAAGARIAVIGAGGSAASVLCAAERCGAAWVRVYNRHMPRAELLCSRFSPLAQASATLSDALEGSSVVINTTPVGMHDDDLPVPIEMLPANSAVFDLIHRRDETPWVRAARQAGHRAADGSGMLLEQGAIAFELWFGVPADRGAMWRAMH